MGTSIKCRVRDLVELMAEEMHTWTDEDVMGIFLDENNSWGSNLCNSKEKRSYLEKKGFRDFDEIFPPG